MRENALGLCMIVKDEEQNIRRVLESIVEYVDHVYLTDTGSTDDTIKIAKQTCKRFKVPITISYFKWIDDYSAARNFNFSQAKTPWIFWLDADDTVENPEKMSLVLERAGIKKATGIAFTYRYHVDKFNIDKATHPKLRIVKNGYYHWTPRAPIHENLFILDEHKSEDLQLFFREIKVRHWKDDAGFVKSGERNLRILKKLYEKEKEEGLKDNRTIFLLGREHHAQWRLTNNEENRAESIHFLSEYIEAERIGGERMTACGLLFDIYWNKGEFTKCRDVAFEAVKSHASNPLGYVLVAKYYAQQEEWEEVIKWIDQSKNRSVDELDPTVQAPKGLLKDASLLLAQANVELKEFDKAAENIHYYLQVSEEGEQEELQRQLGTVKNQNLEDKILESFTRLVNVTLQQDKLESLKHLISALPTALRNKAPVLKLRRSMGLNTKHPKGSIAIFCGVSFEEWHEGTLDKGMGGSETAVVEMAKRIGKAGYQVTVYGSVEEDKVFGNVKYTHASKVDWADQFDIFISWRNPLIVDMFKILANKKFLWLHDVPSVYDYSPSVYNSFDKIIVLSNYHRSLLPDLPDEKFYISSNGIDVESIKKIEKEKIQRNPFRVVYASSADRGLENLLNIWAEVKKEVPEAELHWAYGWNTFDALRGGNKEAMAWKEKMIQKMNKLGVIQHGRLSKDDLYRLYFSSSIWAYPTQFQEINCIVAQEAQACGLFPITTGFAALKEVQLFGAQYDISELPNILKGSMCIGNHRGGLEMRQFKGDENIHAYNPSSELYNTILPDSYNMGKLMLKARKKFSWNKTATSWMVDLFYGLEIEQNNPLVSIVCVTIRPGIFRVLRETIEAQTYQNIELIVVDGRYEERKAEVAKYMKDFKYPFLHLPDPKRDTKKYPYGLFHADNAAVYATRGELVVFLQDFILMPKDGIEKYVNLYRTDPDKIYTGVDTRNPTQVIQKVHMKQNGKFTKIHYPLNRDIDIFQGIEYKLGPSEFTSPRIRIGNAKRPSGNPFEWELNWCAAPKAILEDMGGWDEDWDTGFAYDNTVFALRFIYEGGEMIVDESNIATAISHWQLFGDNDSEGVPHRNKKPNDNRYQNYARTLSQRNINTKLKLKEPNYPRKIKAILKKWKNFNY